MNREDNDLLTQVENGAALGEMIRSNHWIPAANASQLEPDGAPLRVRLLGGDYVAFRATDGRIGFFDEACPHRGASLALARNEDCALTCIFHGLQIDVGGKVRAAPVAGAHSAEAASNIRVRHYPAREAGGLVWVWLGDGTPKPFPELPFTRVPASHVHVGNVNIPVNFVQALEITLDSSHTGFLHRDWLPYLNWPYNAAAEDLAKIYELEDTNYGFRAAAVRETPNGREVVTSEFVMPFHSSTATGLPNEGSHHILVPSDNKNTLWFMVRWNEVKPLERPARAPEARTDEPRPEGFLGQDRAAMKTGSFAGFKGGLLPEDIAVALSMGPIVDRTKEHLLPVDRNITRMRSQLLRAAREHRAGERPFGADPAIDYSRLMGVAGVIAKEAAWTELVTARP
jgi:phenylpropionate dioxygenase-like ring-hydroxylating dioxygenase large terminal subunit